MKGRKIISLAAAFLLAVMTFISLPHMAAIARADSGDAAMQMGASALSKGANTTGAQVLAYGGQNWYVIAHDGSSAALLAKNNIGLTKYDPDTISNAYGTSTLKTKVDEIASGFTTLEKGAVK